MANTGFSTQNVRYAAVIGLGSTRDALFGVHTELFTAFVVECDKSRMDFAAYMGASHERQ